MSKEQDGEDQAYLGEDAFLVESARKGDLSAFEALVKKYQRQATSVALGLLNDMDDALEVTQDALLRAYNKIGTLSDPNRFGPWLLKIVSNLALNRRRYRKLRRTLPLDGSADGDDGSAPGWPDPKAQTPDAIASGKDVQSLMEKAIAELPEMQRQALLMFCINGLPQKDIAQALECSVEAVKWHVFTARKKLKEKLKDYL